MLNYLLARTLGHLPLNFRGRHRIINALWPEGGTPRINQITRLPIGNLAMYADSRNQIGWNILAYGWYEKPLVLKMRELIEKKSRQTAVDAGANLGYYSLILSRFFKKVYSFEPVPGFRKLMERNLELNHINNIVLQAFALGTCEREVEMAVLKYHDVLQTASKNRGKHDFKDVFKWEFEKVKQVRLDSILGSEEGPIDYIKIDTDGSEYDILAGASAILDKHRPILQIEMCGFQNWLGDESLLDTVGFLQAKKYKFYNEKGKFLKKVSSTGNYFALPEEIEG